jgi:adenylate cyclase
MDWEATGLLDGLDGEARDARRRLLDELHADGVSREELERACAEDRLVLLPIERALFGEARLTASQLAEEAGLPLDWLRHAWRAMGLSLPPADEVAYSEQDLEAARRVKTYRESGLPDDELLGIMRVMGTSLARTADVVRAAFGRALLEEGVEEDELARRYALSAEALLPLAEADVAYLLRLHMRELIRQDAISHAELRSGELSRTTDMAVAFADLVGFTKLGEESDVEVLGDVASLLLEHTEQVVAAPVRLVKTIGDAVMLAAPEPAPLLAALLDLIDRVDADERLPPLRAGVAMGPTLQRFGDLYGATVNVSARLCARARPSSILVTDEIHDIVGPDGFDWSRAGEKKLKGIASPVHAWRARRAQPDPA